MYDSDDRSCSGREYTAGEAYLDPGYGHVHLGRNESTTAQLQITVTNLDVPLGAWVREDAADPGTCTF